MKHLNHALNQQEDETQHTTRMGFEPTRAEHNGLAVHRLNHSATSSLVGLGYRSQTQRTSHHSAARPFDGKPPLFALDTGSKTQILGRISSLAKKNL
ncbi:unnamed protein product [Protopolystoma xenopodis]|uniref:Uncharacterized protein n=1 Tax=Protopolystoma xenopodis TaxID=117903 RepID=A0A3S5AG13_9PLAT|nr:unnamed protein product [Protopolystoma xenopodis]